MSFLWFSILHELRWIISTQYCSVMPLDVGDSYCVLERNLTCPQNTMNRQVTQVPHLQCTCRKFTSFRALTISVQSTYITTMEISPSTQLYMYVACLWQVIHTNLTSKKFEKHLCEHKVLYISCLATWISKNK